MSDSADDLILCRPRRHVSEICMASYRRPAFLRFLSFCSLGQVHRLKPLPVTHYLLYECRYDKDAENAVTKCDIVSSRRF